MRGKHKRRPIASALARLHRLRRRRGLKRLPDPRPGWLASRVREVTSAWTHLHQGSDDLSGTHRAARLIHRLSSSHRQPFESALAELEFAVLLLRGGVQVRFLPESQSRTADFECHLAGQRFFVEVTALMTRPDEPSPSWIRQGWPAAPDTDEAGPAATAGQLLTRRILGRLAQKARQLSDYCAPVVLVIFVPPVDRSEAPGRGKTAMELDVKQLAGMIAVALGGMRHISAVLLALWDIEPSAARSGVRLSRVHVVERSGHHAVLPRVRLLAQNSSAAWPLSETVGSLLRSLL